jgi:hypothetical protein
MKLLVSGATATIDRLAGHPQLGRLITPDNGNAVEGLVPWEFVGADNSTLGQYGVRPDYLLRMWDALAFHRPPGLRFVACPDDAQRTSEGIVVTWIGTLALWRSWRDALFVRGLPAAIVLQDGATVDTIPWDEISAVFVGGTTKWKLSKTAAMLIRVAKKKEKWVHVGRINTMGRLNHFDPLPVDSFDGTQFSMFPDRYIPKYLHRLTYQQEGFKHAA